MGVRRHRQTLRRLRLNQSAAADDVCAARRHGRYPAAAAGHAARSLHRRPATGVARYRTQLRPDQQARQGLVRRPSDRPESRGAAAGRVVGDCIYRHLGADRSVSDRHAGQCLRPRLCHRQVTARGRHGDSDRKRVDCRGRRGPGICRTRDCERNGDAGYQTGGDNGDQGRCHHYQAQVPGASVAAPNVVAVARPVVATPAQVVAAALAQSRAAAVFCRHASHAARRMLSATSSLAYSDMPTAPNQPLWISLALSLLAHAIGLAVFAGLLLAVPASVSLKLGDPAVMQIRLSGSQPAEPAPEPAAVVAAAPTRAVVELAPTPVPSIKPQEPLPPEPPVPVRRIDLRAPAARATGTPIAGESTPDALASDTPIPPGDVAVGAAETAEPMGHAQALRLAQRFPQAVAKPPQLRDPLVVPYPARAARAHREARIAALLIIDADGKALEATLLPDDPLFGPTVEDALRGAKFKPAEADSRPVTHWLVLEFVFTMRPSAPPRAAKER